jgi:hypothetical protein
MFQAECMKKFVDTEDRKKPNVEKRPATLLPKPK